MFRVYRYYWGTRVHPCVKFTVKECFLTVFVHSFRQKRHVSAVLAVLSVESFFLNKKFKTGFLKKTQV